MAASAIAISFDSSDESVGSLPSRVILFGDIPTVIPSTSVVAPETSTIAPVISSAALVVEMTLVASPTGLCGLVPYSGSDSDSPDEMSSPEHISPLPTISPFLCIDFSEAPDSSDGPPSQDPYVAIIDPILIRPGEAIPFGRAYRTHFNGPRKLLAARKRLVPLPARKLAWEAFITSSLTITYLLLVLLWIFASSFLREASRHWLLLHLSTCNPPTTSESSSRDSSERPMHSSSHSAGPSRKRCRSLVDSVLSSTPVLGSLAPTRVCLLPTQFGRRGSRFIIPSEATREVTEINPIETEVNMELGIGDGDDVGDHVKIDPRDVRDDIEEYEADISAGDTVEVGIDLMSAPIVEEEIIEPAREDSSGSSGTREESFYPFEIETVQRRLEADQLIARGQRVSMIERIDSLRLENLMVRAMLDIKRDHVNNLRLNVSFTRESFC
ncbi:hypothetical protein Tco_1504232 [Tanacetum coccineum]